MNIEFWMASTLFASGFGLWQFIQRCRADREACEWELVADELAEGVAYLTRKVMIMEKTATDDNQGDLFK